MSQKELAQQASKLGWKKRKMRCIKPTRTLRGQKEYVAYLQYGYNSKTCRYVHVINCRGHHICVCPSRFIEVGK